MSPRRPNHRRGEGLHPEDPQKHSYVYSPINQCFGPERLTDLPTIVLSVFGIIAPSIFVVVTLLALHCLYSPGQVCLRAHTCLTPLSVLSHFLPICSPSSVSVKSCTESTIGHSCLSNLKRQPGLTTEPAMLLKSGQVEVASWSVTTTL